MRQLRAEEGRDSVEKVFYGLLALDQNQRLDLVARWAHFHRDREASSPRLVIIEPGVPK